MQNQLDVAKKAEPLKLMKYLQIYLLSTVLLYFVGPVKWQTQFVFLTFTLVALYQLFLYFGYNYAKRRNDKVRTSYFFSFDWFKKYYALLSAAYILMNVLRMVRIMQLYGFSGIISLITSAFNSASSIYNAQKLVTTGSQMFGGPLLSAAGALLGPISVAIIPTTVARFKKLGKGNWPLAIANIAIFIISNIISGTNEGYAHIVIYLMIGLLLREKKAMTPKELNRQRKTKRNVLILAAVAIVVLFNVVMSDRNGTYYTFSQLRPNTIDENNWLLAIFPGMRVLIIWLTAYICQGYYGMSLALGVHWNPMFGLGFSPYLRSNVEELLGLNLAPNTLMYQTGAFGWDYGVNWHTAYTWFACDVWWLGVVFVMFAIGYLLCVMYRAAYRTYDPVAIGMLSLLIILIIFLPANNKVFALSDTFFAFFFYLFVWIFSKRGRPADV